MKVKIKSETTPDKTLEKFVKCFDLQSGILEQKGDALSSYYANYANLIHWRVEMTVSYFLFYEYNVLSIFCK